MQMQPCCFRSNAFIFSISRKAVGETIRTGGSDTERRGVSGASASMISRRVETVICDSSAHENPTSA